MCSNPLIAQPEDHHRGNLKEVKVFDQRGNEDKALRTWRAQLEQFERILASPNCNLALPHVRRWIEEKQHLQMKIAELEAKRAREDAIRVHSKQAPEPAVQGTPTADTKKGFDGLGQKEMDLTRYFDTADLTERQRECASMKYEYGLPVAKIARRLNIHRTTVQESLDAAIKRLARDHEFKQALKRRAARRGSDEE